MGFFSDLKEDLSQAVNELMPDELTDKTVEDELAEDTAETVGDAEVTSEETLENEMDDFSVELSLEEMLKNIDSIQISEDYEMQPEATVTESMDASLEAVLAAALDSIPEENGEADMNSFADSFSGIETPLVEEPLVTDYPALDAQEPAVEDTTVKEITVDNEKEDKGADEKMDSYANRQATDETAVITSGMQIKGDITSQGSVDVVGTVDGNIEVWGKLNITGHVNGNSHAAEIYAEGAKINGEIVSSGAVKIGDSSVIIGNITAKSAAIAGAVKGDIDVQGPVVLDASAIVMGNIKSKSVQINNGAVIEGMCSQCYADVSPLSFFDEYKTEIKNSKKNK